MTIIMETQDQFELEFYVKKYKHLLGRANLLLGLDVEQNRSGLMKINAALFTLNEIQDENGKMILENQIIPYCKITEYVQFSCEEYVVAEGFGLCNKNWDKATWKETAIMGATLDAKANLIAKVKQYVKRVIKSSGRRVDAAIIESITEGFISDTERISVRFDENKCRADVKLKVKRSNIKIIVGKKVLRRE